ncbi:MAG: nicotinate phosphoribosyltransferase [candidate division NC10 bacterium]|nr:nicotinate phosphoribosyltransferase [candidate division NC10 bacterium]
MFHIAKELEIKEGRVTDIYFARTVQILKAKGRNPRTRAEIVLKGFPSGWQWGIFAGLDEALDLLEGIPVDVEAIQEGSWFRTLQPVMAIEGNYLDYAIYETALLGILCQASGVATKTARCKKAAGGKSIISFGARRMHPAIAPMIDRSAFIGGCDAVSVIASAEAIGEAPMGTMPHSLILIMGDVVEAAKAFHQVIDPQVHRVVLVDTFCDEKAESLKVAEVLGKDLYGVRLDTPSSRRGDIYRILQEVRWELDYRGYGHVKLFVSGGLDEEEIRRLRDIVHSFGVGTSISNAPVLDFGMDIVEIEGRPVAKRGKMSGAKQVWRCPSCRKTEVLPSHSSPDPCSCGETLLPLLRPMLQKGKRVCDSPPPQQIRSWVLAELPSLPG